MEIEPPTSKFKHTCKVIKFQILQVLVISLTKLTQHLLSWDNPKLSVQTTNQRMQSVHWCVWVLWVDFFQVVSMYKHSDGDFTDIQHQIHAVSASGWILKENSQDRKGQNSCHSCILTNQIKVFDYHAILKLSYMYVTWKCFICNGISCVWNLPNTFWWNGNRDRIYLFICRWVEQCLWWFVEAAWWHALLPGPHLPSSLRCRAGVQL